MSGSVHTGRLPGTKHTHVRAKCPDSVTDSAQIRGSNVVAKAYVPEKNRSFAVKVEIIRDVSTVRGPNDFGKSRV